ncbi:MAG: exonuclease [Planctomycetota bacterium]
MPNSEIYIATAIETDGPIPGPHSMLSLASAAYQRDKTLVSTFTVNLELLPDAEGDHDTMAWWMSKPEAWAVCRHEPEPIGPAMRDYVDWLDHLPGRPIYVGHPAAGGYMFVAWYLHRYVGRNPFGRGALDLRTMAMTLLHQPHRKSKMRFMPEEWIHDSPPRTYVALDDAQSVGRLMCHMFDSWETMSRLPIGEPEMTLRLKDED